MIQTKEVHLHTKGSRQRAKINGCQVIRIDFIIITDLNTIDQERRDYKKHTVYIYY